MGDLFQIGLSGIYSSQANLSTTSHNIANINTDGYSRQKALIETAGGDRKGHYFVGRGSLIQGIERAYDQFAYTENILNTSQAAYTKENFQQNNQMDMLFSDESTAVTKPVLELFESMNGVADNPNLLESRTVLLESASNMISQYNRLYDTLEVQYAGINNDIVNSADTVTTLADNIADLNKQISAVLGNGIESNANDLLDQRGQAINELSQYVDVSIVETENAMVNVYIGSGQSLVMGTESMKMISVNGVPDPSRKQLAFNINGNISLIKGQGLGGQIAAMFDTRNNDLESAFNQLGQNVIGLTHSINEQQKEGMTLDGEIGADLFNDINALGTMKSRVLAHDDGLGSAQLSVRIDDLSELKPDEYKLVVDSYDSGSPESISFTSTNKSTGETQSFSIADLSVSKRVDIPNTGLSLGIDAIIAADPPQVGKTFTLRPTRLAAQQATLVQADPEKVAAADAEIKTTSNEANAGNAVLRTSALIDPLDSMYMDAENPLSIAITAIDATTGDITYDVLDKDGMSAFSALTTSVDSLTGKATFGFAGVEIEMIKGSAQVGDIFTLSYNETGDGDNRNMVELAELQTEKRMNDGKATFADVYNGMLSDIGAKTSNANVAMEAAEVLKTQSTERIQGLSGVNMDEEAANLLQYQQHYSAASRIISVANELFDTILDSTR